MSPEERQRLDVLLVERGLAESRAKAQALILAGRVRVDGEVAAKAGARFAGDAEFLVEPPARRWVGRGGEKLAGALDRFGVDPAGRTALDIGASTGGFTHVLLERGAATVVAVDVGYGQLDWSLRNDARVRLLERVNARHLTPEQLPRDLGEEPDLAVVDVAFISLRKVLPAVLSCLREPCEILALVKPQFEAGRERVGKGGIVRDPEVHREVLERLLEWIDDEAERHVAGRRLHVRGLCASSIRGARGNREFFLWIAAGAQTPPGGPRAADMIDEALREESPIER